jgi:hypothetical protein
LVFKVAKGVAGASALALGSCAIAADGEALAVSVNAAVASIMVGSTADGAASMVSLPAFETGPGNVDASEMQAPSMPAESNNTTRVTVLLGENVVRIMSSDRILRKLKFAA